MTKPGNNTHGKPLLSLAKEITFDGEWGDLRIMLRRGTTANEAIVAAELMNGDAGSDMYVKARSNFGITLKQYLRAEALYEAAPGYMVRPIATIWMPGGTFLGYAMEKASGRTLGDMIWAGEYTAAVAKAVLPQIKEFIKMLERQGLCHGDLQPHNIMVDNSLRIKVLDPDQRRRGTAGSAGRNWSDMNWFRYYQGHYAVKRGA